MSRPTKQIAVLELRRLLVELKEHRPDICVRYRIMGQMWAGNFMRVSHVSDRGAIFNNETVNRLVNVQNLNQIIQFELDKSFQAYQPYFHYDVVPSPEW